MSLPDDVLRERLEMRDRGADCLSDRTLSDLAVATLPDDEFRRAQVHLGTCLTCLQAYASLRRLLEIADSRALRARVWLVRMPRLSLPMPSWPSRARRPFVGWAAAAVMMALLAWMISPSERASPPQVSSGPPPIDREVERQILKQARQSAADTARAQMVAAKQRASPESPGFAEGVQSEKQAIALYAQEAFTEATASFRSATELFAGARPAGPTQVAARPAAPPPERAHASPPRATLPPERTQASAPPVAAEPAVQASNASERARVEIKAVLETYVRAVETKDLELLRRVRPSLTAGEINRARVSNEIKRSHKTDLRVDEITVTGEVAEAQGWREDVVVLNTGQRLQTETKFSYTLKHGERGWVIQEVREASSAPRGETRAPAPEPRN